MKNEHLAELARRAEEAAKVYAEAARIHSRFPEAFPDGTVLRFTKSFDGSSFRYTYAALLIHTDLFGPWWYLSASPRGKTFPRLSYDELKKFIGEEEYQILVPIEAQTYFTAVAEVKNTPDWSSEKKAELAELLKKDTVFDRNNERFKATAERRQAHVTREQKKREAIELAENRPNKNWATVMELHHLFGVTTSKPYLWWKGGVLKRREVHRTGNHQGLAGKSKWEYHVPTVKKLLNK